MSDQHRTPSADTPNRPYDDSLDWTFDYPLRTLTKGIDETETMAVPRETLSIAVDALRAHIARAVDNEDHPRAEDAIDAYRLMATTSAALALLLRALEMDQRDGDRLRFDLRLLRDFVRDPETLPQIEADRRAGTIDEALANRVEAIVKEIRSYWTRHYDVEAGRRGAKRPWTADCGAEIGPTLPVARNA